MPARKGPKKINKYSNALKRTAVPLRSVPGVKVKGVAESLGSHSALVQAGKLSGCTPDDARSTRPREADVICSFCRWPLK
jgi:hypothetical protein